MPLPRNQEPAFAVFDVETTGLSPKRGARILEIAVVRINAGGDVLAEYQTLLNTEGAGVGATHIHGITSAMVAGAPTFRDIAPALLDCLRGAVLAAHNSRFDLNFLGAECAKLDQPFAPPVLCTMALRSMLRLPGPAHGRRSASKLEWACAQHGISLANAHCALADTRAAAALLVQYLKVARSLGLTGLGQLGVDIHADAIEPEAHLVGVSAAPCTRWTSPVIAHV